MKLAIRSQDSTNSIQSLSLRAAASIPIKTWWKRTRRYRNTCKESTTKHIIPIRNTSTYLLQTLKRERNDTLITWLGNQKQLTTKHHPRIYAMLSTKNNNKMNIKTLLKKRSNNKQEGSYIPYSLSREVDQNNAR